MKYFFCLIIQISRICLKFFSKKNFFLKKISVFESVTDDLVIILSSGKH